MANFLVLPVVLLCPFAEIEFQGASLPVVKVCTNEYFDGEQFVELHYQFSRESVGGDLPEKPRLKFRFLAESELHWKHGETTGYETATRREMQEPPRLLGTKDVLIRDVRPDGDYVLVFRMRCR